MYERSLERRIKKFQNLKKEEEYRIIEETRENKVYIALGDLEKAPDTVLCRLICNSLIAGGESTHLCIAVKNLYQTEGLGLKTPPCF